MFVVADDFGYCEERDRGILEAHAKGCVTHTSVLINGCKSCEQRACFCGSKNFTSVSLEQTTSQLLKSNLEIGLHFNLTEGEPTANVNAIATLVNADGQFHGKVCVVFDRRNSSLFKEKFGILSALNQIEAEHVRTELNAQLDRFESLFGRLPTHIDGHNHVHVFGPNIVDVVIDVVRDRNIERVRLPLETQETTKTNTKQESFHHTVTQFCTEAKQKFIENNIVFCDRFVGLQLLLNTSSVDGYVEQLCQQIDSIAVDDTIEVMCHPGYCDSRAGADPFSRSDAREVELRALCDDRVRALMARRRKD